MKHKHTIAIDDAHMQALVEEASEGAGWRRGNWADIVRKLIRAHVEERLSKRRVEAEAKARQQDRAAAKAKPAKKGGRRG